MITRSLIVSLMIFLSGCTFTREARLYPDNDLAASGGVIKATFEAHGTGHGEVTMIAPNGEILKGEFSIVRQGIIGFGSIFSSLSKGNAFSANYQVEGASQGIASAFGDNGTRVSCEFLNDNDSGHGYGACKTSKNAVYRLQY